MTYEYANLIYRLDSETALKLDSMLTEMINLGIDEDKAKEEIVWYYINIIVKDRDE